jgi:hypothetical protein
MPESLFGKETPQFGTAEYQGVPSPDVCKLCQQPIMGQYYRANTAMLCPGCAERVRQQAPQDSHGAFMRALFFGLGGFVVALVAYSLIGILLRGWTIGYLALGVGWIVGKAMMTGSKGVGGRRYQIVAVLLTYAAVSMSAVPIGISLAWNQISEQSQKASHPPAQTSQPADQTSHPPAQTSPQPATAEQKPADSASQPQDAKQPDSKPSVGAFLGQLLWWGLASPFLGLQDGIGGILMLVILFVGMQFAWRMTRGVHIMVDGPFQTASATKE